MQEEPTLLLCTCSSVEHQMMIWKDEETHEAYCEIHLLPIGNFWKRLVNGIKYIFGHRSRYGDFDEIILDKRHSDKLIELGEFLKSETVKENL